MRDKLIELIQNAVGGCARHWAELIADALIANGVTLQQWIPVSERLPEEQATVFVLCKNGAVFSGYRFNDYENAVRWRIHTALSSTKLLNKGRVTHWMLLPEPPKEGE